jgi:uncharacterized membrane protein
MKRLVVLAVFFFEITTWSYPAKAGLFFCNETGQAVDIAVGWNEDGTWLSRGWFHLQPQECGATLLGVLKNTFYYYYAETAGDQGLVWSGTEGGGGFFCTSDKAFNYRNDNTNCAGKTFHKVIVGDADQYTETLVESQTDPKRAALNCRGEISNGRDAFAKCWMRNVATNKQREILDCYGKTATYDAFAICASKDVISADAYKVANCASAYNRTKIGSEFLKCVGQGTLTDEQARIFNCAVTNKGDFGAMGACALASGLTPEQQRVYSCVANNLNDYVKAGLCAAASQLTPEQNRIAGCVLNNRGSYAQMGVCAVGSNLIAEQQVFVSCAITTGGQPYAFAGCVGTQLTLNELQKCMTDGIGGSGCFGDNNTAVKFVSNAFKDVTQGPGPSNDLLGRDGWVGRKAQDVANDLAHGPGESNDLVGRCGFVGTALFGGC